MSDSSLPLDDPYLNALSENLWRPAAVVRRDPAQPVRIDSQGNIIGPIDGPIRPESLPECLAGLGRSQFRNSTTATEPPIALEQWLAFTPQ